LALPLNGRNHIITFHLEYLKYGVPKVDDLVKSSKAVTPANAGVQKWLIFLDSRVRGNDENGSFLTFYEFVNIELEIFLNFRHFSSL